MPSITKEYYHNIDLLANQLLNSRLHNITTAARIVLGSSLTAQDKGYQVYDTNLLTPFYWNGVSWATVTAVTTWGSITGILSNQTDLQNALNAKFDDPAGTTVQYIRGDGSLATFPTIPTITPAALTRTNDTNVTLTLGGTPNTSLLQSVSLTLGWTGTLADSRIASASTWNGKQNALSGTGIVTSTAGTISYILGTSSQFVKGDGSLDGSTYLTTAVTSVGAGTGMNFTTITGTGNVAIDTAKVPYYATTPSNGLLKYTSGVWGIDTSSYLTAAVTSIATSGLISGGTITSTGTISTSMNTNKLVGRSTAGVGVMEEITVGTGLSLSAGTLSSSGGIPHAIAAGIDTYTATIAGVTSYAEGDAYIIRFTNGNTTSCTLNINGIGAAPLYRNNDGVLIGGDIIDNGDMLCVYDTSLPGFRVIGTAPNTLLGYVTNDDSVTITKGQVVYAFGGTGDRMTVKLANNTADATSARTVGVVLSTSIAANQKGLIMIQGLLDGLSILPTATWNDGDPVYLGATPGSITNVKPYAPAHLVYIGVVTTASPGSSGRMYVKIQNGYELDELHNVQAQSPTYKDTLWYDNTVSPAQWKTASISTILGYTPVGPNDTDYEYLMMSSFRNTYNY